MKTILVLEDDKHEFATLQSIINKINSDIQIEHFEKATSFYSWVKSNIEKKKKGGENDVPEILCVISDYHLLEGINLPLLDKIQKMFIQEGFTPNENPCGFVITAFENLDFNVKNFIHSKIYNILFKPFDALLTETSLKMAVNGRGPIESDLYTQKAPGRVEILKDVNTSAITELGFRTESKNEIPIGKKARYYSSILDSEQLSYLFAYCTRNRPHPDRQGEFISSFSYFGTSKRHLNALRRYIRSHKNHENIPLEDEPNLSHFSEVIFISSKPDHQNFLKDTFESHFINLKIKNFNNLFEFYENLSGDLLDPNEHGGYVNLLSGDEPVWLIFDESQKNIIDIRDQRGESFSDQDLFFNMPLGEVKGKNPLKTFLNSTEINKWNKFFIKKNPSIIELQVSDIEKSKVELLKIERELQENGENAYKVYVKNVDYINTKNQSPINMNVVDVIFVDKSNISQNQFLRFKKTMERLSEKKASLRFIAVSEQPIITYEYLEEHKDFHDYISLPFDRFYLVRALKQALPHLVAKDPQSISREGIVMETTLQAALPVNLSQISECHISLTHTRALAVGEVRRFVLIDDTSENLPEIWGMCNHSEKLGGSNYRNDFIFFALKDHHLKFVRKWMKSAYIKSKSNG